MNRLFRLHQIRERDVRCNYFHKFKSNSEVKFVILFQGQTINMLLQNMMAAGQNPMAAANTMAAGPQPPHALQSPPNSQVNVINFFQLTYTTLYYFNK